MLFTSRPRPMLGPFVFPDGVKNIESILYVSGPGFLEAHFVKSNFVPYPNPADLFILDVGKS